MTSGAASLDPACAADLVRDQGPAPGERHHVREPISTCPWLLVASSLFKLAPVPRGSISARPWLGCTISARAKR